MTDLGFGVHPDEVQVLPDHVHQSVQVPLQVRAHRAVVWQLGDDIELLQRDLVDLVDHIDGRDIDAGPLDNVHLERNKDRFC